MIMKHVIKNVGTHVVVDMFGNTVILIDVVLKQDIRNERVFEEGEELKDGTQILEKNNYNNSFIFCLIEDISYSLYKLPDGLYSSINL